MGLNVTYNLVSFYMMMWLKKGLCTLDYYQYYDLCYDYNDYGPYYYDEYSYMKEDE